MAKTDIETQNMVITYNKGKSNEFNALDNVNVQIYPREYIILFGPSGCGKSTLLYTMLGGIPPESGHMVVKGEDIYAYSPEEMNEYQQSVIGIVYQQFNLITSISVLDNVALPRLFMNASPAERNERARILLRRFGIPERLENKTPVMMSGGQQQRVAVARSLINDPEILLADEPVGNLDSISAEHVMESFEEINSKDRKTVILVTHDAKYLPYAHRVFYMRDGKLRRIVVNPEKPQVKRTKPGETIVTEIEQLARLYPYDEPIVLKVKSITNYVTQTIGFNQIMRLEDAILEVLKGQLDDAMLMERLTKPLVHGGIGLELEESKKIAKRVFTLVRYSQDVAKYRQDREDASKIIHQRKFVDHLMEYISEEVGLAATQQQQKILREAVADRIGGITNGDEFEKRLGYTFDMGGAQFEEKYAHLISRHLEKLIAQGGYVIRANELAGAHS